MSLDLAQTVRNLYGLSKVSRSGLHKNGHLYVMIYAFGMYEHVQFQFIKHFICHLV